MVHDNAAGGNDYDWGSSVTIDGSGNIVVTGESTNASGNSDMTLWRFTAASDLDTSFGSGNGYVFSDTSTSAGAMVLDGDGCIVVAGITMNASGLFDNMALWRFAAGADGYGDAHDAFPADPTSH